MSRSERSYPNRWCNGRYKSELWSKWWTYILYGVSLYLFNHFLVACQCTCLPVNQLAAHLSTCLPVYYLLFSFTLLRLMRLVGFQVDPILKVWIVIILLASWCQFLCTYFYMFCLNSRYLAQNFDWLQEQLDEQEDDYILFDCPGKCVGGKK